MLRFIALLLLASPVAATAQLPEPALGPPAIGVLLPLSGEYQSFGEACLRGIRLAVRAVGVETPLVRTVVHDTRGDAGEALNGYRRLAADPGIVAVLGPMLSWEASAVRSETELIGLPVVSFSQRAFPSGAPFFRFSMSREDQARVLAGYLVGERGLRRWAILHPEDSFGRDLSLLFRDRVESLGGEVLAVSSYEAGTTDFQKAVGRLRPRIGFRESEDKPLELRVDGIFLPDTAATIRLVAPTLAFFDIHGAQLAGANGWNEGEKLAQALPYVEGAVFVDGFFLYSFLPSVRSFVDGYRDAYAYNPGVLEAYGYDAAGLLLEDLRAGAAGREGVLERMYTPLQRAGATGWTTRTAFGELEKELFLLTLREGTVREIERERPAPPRPQVEAPRTDPWRRPQVEAPETDAWRPPEFDSRRPGTLGEEPFAVPGR